MRVLHVITSLKKASGASTFCGALCNALVRLGHVVTVAVPEARLYDEGYALSPNVKLESFERMMTSDETYDVIHIHGIWEYANHKASMMARGRGVPYVISTHGSTAPWAMNHRWWKKALFWYLYFRRDL